MVKWVFKINGVLIGFLDRLFSVFENEINSFKIIRQTTKWKNRFNSIGKSPVIWPQARFVNPYNISIGDFFYLGTGGVIESIKPNKSLNGGIIEIGNNCRFGEFCHISSINNVAIGDGFLGGRFLLITDNAHGDTSGRDNNVCPWKRRLTTKGKIKIGRNVWFGDRVSVLSGVTIGDGVIAAVNSTITKDIPPYALVAGSPAKVIKIMKETS